MRIKIHKYFVNCEHPRFMEQSLIISYVSYHIKKEKGALQDNRKEKDTQGFTRTRSRLIVPKVPLVMPELLN